MLAPPDPQTPRQAASPPEPDPERVITIFSALFDAEPAARTARLEELCGANGELRSAVLDLLAHHDDPPRILTRLASQAAADGIPGPPRMLGSYEISEAIGRGGMGIVYRALQRNPRRTVAIKILSPLLQGRASIARFEREIRVLGLLQHPGICQIHDAGSAELGLGLGEILYFVMEFVDGVPLTRYVAERSVDLAGRCALLAEVCDAVQHAHDQGVIHRDLKPGNLLVCAPTAHAPEPRIKVLDFGIARTLAGDVTAASAPTRTGGTLGTMLYMSPEQLAGSERVDFRTDVYSLGAVMYELLAGRPPLPLADRPLSEVVKMVRDREPTPLGKVDARLRGDLQAIAAKATAKDPDERYATVAALGADLRRYLRGEAVAARPPSLAAQLRRLARRNKPLVGGAAATLLVLLSGLVAVSVLASANKALAGREATARQTAEGLSERLRLALYHAEMQLASVAFTTGGGVARAAKILPGWEPAPGTKDLRGFEWHLLSAHCNQAVLVHPCVDKPNGLHWLAAGDMIFSSHHEADVLTHAGSGEPAHRFAASVRPLSCAAISQDGHLLVRTVAPGVVAVMDAATRATLRTLEHPWDVRRLALTRDGALVAVGGGPDVVFVWETRTGKRVGELASWAESPLAFSRDGGRLATTVQDGDESRVRIWDLRSLRAPDCQLECGHEVLTSLSFSPSGRELATGSAAGWLRVWSLEGKRLVASLAHAARLREVAFADEGRRIAVACDDYAAYVHDLDTRSVRQLSGHASAVSALGWSPHGNRLATMADLGTLHVWDLDLRPSVQTLVVPSRGILWDTQIAWDAAGAALAIRVAEVAARTVALGSGDERPFFTLAAEGDRCEIGVDRSNEIRVKALDAAGAPLVGSLSSEPFYRIAASLRRPVVAIGSRGALRIWDYRSGTPPRVVKTFDVCRGLAWNPCADTLAILDGSDEVRVLDEAGTVLAARSYPMGALALACSPRGDELAVACVDQSVRLWNPTTGTERALVGHAAHVHSVAFHPDGTRLASGSQDRTVKIWDLQAGVEVLTLPHAQCVCAVEWSRDGRRLASADTSGLVKVWDATSARKRRE